MNNQYREEDVYSFKEREANLTLLDDGGFNWHFDDADWLISYVANNIVHRLLVWTQSVSLWLIGKFYAKTIDRGWVMIFFCLFNFFWWKLHVLLSNYLFCGHIWLAMSNIGKSTASNVKHSFFTKKFAVFFKEFWANHRQLMSSFLVNPHHPIMLKFASWNCTFAHFCFLSTSIWLLNFWLSPIAWLWIPRF